MVHDQALAWCHHRTNLADHISDYPMRALQITTHVALLLYVMMVGLLMASLVAASSLAYVHFVLIFLTSLLISYALFWKLASRIDLGLAVGGCAARGDRAAVLLLIIAVAFVVAHFVRLGGIPVVHGMLELDYYVVMLIRQYVFHDELHALWRYGPNILVKSVFPFLAFYFLFRSRLLLVVTLVIGGLYGISLMNKMFIVLLVIPAAISALIVRRWLAVAGLAMIPALGLAFIIQVQNPHLQPQAFVDAMDQLRTHTSLSLAESERSALIRYYEVQSAIIAAEAAAEAEAAGRLLGHHGDRSKVFLPDVVRKDKDTNTLSLAVDTLYRRVFLVPGNVMTSWFSLVPSYLPFAEGCGYRWLAPLIGCKYVAYSVVVNSIENPGLGSRGVRGSMTAASFVEDYANFGKVGLVVSGMVMAAILAIIGRLFGTAWQANIALNAVPLILLLELPLSTVILTGGWIVTLLLYLIIAPHAAHAPDHVRSP
jgi:hypothetical protein